MGIAIELISGQTTFPGVAFTAVTANTGSSFTVRAADAGSKIYLEEMWAHEATPGEMRVRSPRMHDNVNGIRMRVPSASAVPLLPEYAMETVYSQDVLTTELTGGVAAEVEVAVLQLYYESLGGTDARVAMWEQIAPRIEHIAGFAVAVTGAATQGDWSAGTAFDTTTDEWKANRDYAILGYEVDSQIAAVAIAGSDTGNLKIGGPAAANPRETRDWFVRQSVKSGRPHIPIINSANKGNTLVHQLSGLASATRNVTFTVALLSGA